MIPNNLHLPLLLGGGHIQSIGRSSFQPGLKTRDVSGEVNSTAISPPKKKQLSYGNQVPAIAIHIRIQDWQQKMGEDWIGVIIWHQPKQCSIIGEIPQNYHTVALFDSPQKIPLLKWVESLERLVGY